MPARYHKSSYFVEEVASRERITTDPVFTEAKRIIEAKTGQRVKPVFMAMLPNTKAEMAADVRETKSGELAISRNTARIQIKIYPHIIKLLKKYRLDNAKIIKIGEKVSVKKAAGKTATPGQKKSLDKMLKRTPEFIAQGEKVIELIEAEQNYPNAQVKGKDLSKMHAVIRNDTNVRGFLVRTNLRLQEYENIYIDSRKRLPFMETLVEISKLYEEIAPNLKGNKLQGSQVAAIYLELLSRGVITKSMKSFRGIATQERNVRLTKARQQALKKPEQAIRRTTKKFIDWSNEKNWTELEKWKAAHQLDSRELYVPEYLREYARKTKKQMGI